MKWKKLGLVFSSAGQRPWMASHATVAIPEHVEGDVFRIYFSPRDAQNRSHVGHLTIDLKRPQSLLSLSSEPALSPGKLGAFDDSGAMGCWIVPYRGERRLYYIGWSLGVTTPWCTTIGLATAPMHTESPVFTRISEAAIMGRSKADPYFATSPCVKMESGKWRLWYASGIRWDPGPDRALPRYNIRYAESDDGIDWHPTGRICIDHAYPGEVAIGRPCVVRDVDCYRMWFSYRGDAFGYRMGYAESPDGLAWRRLACQPGLEHSPSGWDSEMVCYPTVFDHDGTRYMLYNGNGFGKAGFGLAVLDS